MTHFDKDTYIECLPVTVYNEIVNALNKDAAWITLANHVAEELQYPCTLWIQSLNEIKHPNDSPGQKLLSELSIKMCTIEILHTLLSDCKLYNILSIISDPEPLSIIMHPTEEFQTSILKVSFGHRLHLCCKAVGMPLPNYIWYHNDNELQHCTSDVLDFIIISASQAGEYRCKVFQIKNDGTLISALTSKAITVQIFSIPVVIEEQPQPLLEVKEGENFTIRCKANSYSKPRYQWFHDNTKLEGETSNILHVKQFSLKNEGKYYCYICNDISEIYTQRTRVMMDLPKFKAVAKIALVIANEEYENHECLLTSKNDAACIGNLLKEIGFEVICLLNLTITQMKNAIKIFSKALVEGVYGLFYFAGHGFKMQESYMLATDAPETYLRKDAICESELLSAFLENDPELLIVILDMCQTLPSKEFNPEIYHEVPTVNVYKSKKNLRNLIQAYSTSSHRPSYEKLNCKYGLYMEHLSEYINKDITVTKLFEEVGKLYMLQQIFAAIDSCFKGKERNQIPMFAVSVTKPFRLTDATYKNKRPDIINYLSELISYSSQTIDVLFKQARMCSRVKISLFMEPYLNIVRIKVLDLPNVEINFFNSIPAKRNNLFQDQHEKECWIHNPQINEGPLVISVSKDGIPIGATALHIKDYIPSLLKLVNI
ncbi:mucosa-associated lymphoid tissue lymphoma translocation protein 1-like isoform X3 [Bombus pyrosoma]|uniref:mucosa-associated lymphoid tissue lymphoma translocation protein 1-like isoform X3 n=1 Tax=Bombus pyrosoma TaxID=396416 RepID=UPI001CB94DBE|nr:mucosa-associated lymphoid tissue lymphoma translocation protein 1-like isoform X3 [Bombus pyrosoma]